MTEQKKNQREDKLLGFDKEITRRDFIGGTLLGADETRGGEQRTRTYVPFVSRWGVVIVAAHLGQPGDAEDDEHD